VAAPAYECNKVRWFAGRTDCVYLCLPLAAHLNAAKVKAKPSLFNKLHCIYNRLLILYPPQPHHLRETQDRVRSFPPLCRPRGDASGC